MWYRYVFGYNCILECPRRNVMHYKPLSGKWPDHRRCKVISDFPRFADGCSQTHNHPIPGINRFEIIAPWQFLCVISTPKVLPGGEVILENSRDQATFKALTSSKVAIGRFVKDFAPKRSRNVIQEDDDDLEA